MSDWKLGRRPVACTACEAPFEDGERHWAVLTIHEGELARQALCWRCFGETPPGDERVFWWRTRHVVRKKTGLQLDLPSIERLFLTLEGRTEESVRELRYLLCLLLLRKRRLKLLRIRRDPEGESFEVRRPRRKESLRVFVYDFTPERMEELRVELLELFDDAGEPDDTEGAEQDAQAGEAEGVEQARQAGEVEDAGEAGETQPAAPPPAG